MAASFGGGLLNSLGFVTTPIDVKLLDKER